jgi:RimJ/RimL family protein N-acetyltransferase
VSGSNGHLQRAGEQRIARYAVVATDGISIGTAGIACNDEDPTEAEVFYALLPDGRHRGAATAAGRALSEWALTPPSNASYSSPSRATPPAKAVANRAGFRPDGEEVCDHRGALTRMLRWVRTTPPRVSHD